MNKSILKHEFRSMKWLGLFSIIIGMFLSLILELAVNISYEQIYRAKNILNNGSILNINLEMPKFLAIVLFSIFAVVQILLQFRYEKGEEVARFLKSLPVKTEDFFKIKLIFGIINITIGFIVFMLGIWLVKNGNQFWLEDLYKASTSHDILVRIESLGNIYFEIGLIYLGILSFYSFLLMVQYTFTNLLGGLVTGILSYFAPIFMVFSSFLIFNKLFEEAVRRGVFELLEYGVYLLPLGYTFEKDYVRIGESLGQAGIYLDVVSAAPAKYILSIIFILLNIFLAYQFAKNKKLEDENKIITFKISRFIFKLGVTICSACLLALVLIYLINVNVSNILFLILLLVFGIIGYFVSDKITKVGNR